MTDSYTPSTPGEPAEEYVEGVPVIRDRRRLDPQTGKVREQPAAAQPAPPQSAEPPAAAPGAAAAAAAHPAAENPGAPAAGIPAGRGAAPGAGGTAPGAPPAADAAPSSAAEQSDADTAALLSAAEQLATDRLGDLQRVQAEYVNYRRRVDRDRDAVRESAVAATLEGLLPVLDDIALARQHGDLEGGPFAAIADKLEAALGRLGLEQYGAAGEPFDPAVHEALMHGVDESAEAGSETVVTQVLQPGYRMTGTGARIIRAARVAVVSPA